MDDQNPTRISKMIREMRSGTDGLQRSRSNSNSFSLRPDNIQRLSTANEVGESLCETPKRQKLDDSASGSLNKTDSEIPGSPWEWRRMKGEIIGMKTRLSHQEATVQQLHKLRHEMEESFKKEKKLLEIELEQDKRMIKQLELRVDVGRKTVQEAKAAQAQAERELSQLRTKMEHKILSLVEDNNKLTEELRLCIKKEVKPDITKPCETSVRNIEDEKKLELAHKKITELEEKLREARVIQQKFEVQCVELHSLKIKYESLESERSMMEDGKKFMQRASKVSELERELSHARDLISSLRESVKGKLLLEEQMATIEHRLQRTESLEKQVSQLEITQSELLSKIAEYEAIGIPGGPIAIRREINRLQQSEAILTAEEGQLRSQIDALKRELETTKQKHEETKKLLTDTTSSQERLSRFVSRLQKKMSLVTRERDSYRQQLDTYEKEITAYQSNETPTVTNERIPMLERAIEGYRELVAKLESDLEVCDGKGLKEENKKLKAEIERLQGELEHRALKGDFNINTRILHYKLNPLALAEQEAEAKQNALLQEVEQLRAVVASGNPSGVPAVSSSLQAKEIAELQQKHEIKIARLKEAFKASSQEYRQACYQLFGWRVDRTKEGQYKLSSQYADSPDDYLFFIVNDDGVNMIETPFSATLSAFIERYLKIQHSVPMFLNAVQSELFDQQTVANVIA
ncbi:mitotic spindle assembly checkpoint protein MAD1 [Nasonia vitripennis]|uniref:Mitotic spindle assembly checkpoint protein MAD1 n=1 Tax=Nasonia vitripennis TaxID=7425 RepID=A0A7M7Q9J7_NASVI|nr:mitotic spindle assembly checkpoint protein MAD1 [Nasonia vitripennis]XP_031783183.1 mitotic spindle assembly checkpoint protein MAD1 [Nasonia vitripennis]XP_031783184.1 mitotic spindle assembly checkpoint protein MAD1 [Nasonia vitripennis]XP_032453897.1 mitotic spindle assembly checkpoint protein MAD1 [Nasonia vitripennis]